MQNSKMSQALRKIASRLYLKNGRIYDKKTGEPRKLRKDNKGYDTFNVKVDGQSMPVPAHRVVAYLKYGSRALGSKVQIRHYDGNSHNDSAKNLKMGDASSNQKDRFRKKE